MTDKMTGMLVAAFFLTMLFPCHGSAFKVTETTAEIGKDCVATGDYSTAMGYQSVASGRASTAMGNGSAAVGDASTAMGEHSSAGGDYSTAIGYAAYASHNYANAIGHHVRAVAEHATIIGWAASADNELSNSTPKSFAVGYRYGPLDSTPEFFVKDGGVGINTTSPATSLHVTKSISGDPTSMANHVAAIENTSGGASPDVLVLKVNIEDPGNGCNFISFADENGNIGSIEGTGGSIQLNTWGGDFAEYLPKADPNETLNSGDIVGLFPDGLRRETQNAYRILVITTAPAVLGNVPRAKDGSPYAAAAFLGQVPVNVQGSVSAGDYITPSGHGDGVGVAVSPSEITAAQYGSIVGRSLESSAEREVKTVNVVVGLPENGLWDVELEAKDQQMNRLEERLAALEARSDDTTGLGLLPGIGIVMGSLGFFWVDRRRRGSGTKEKA